MKEGHFTKEIAPVSVKGRKGAVTEVSGYREDPNDLDLRSKIIVIY